MLPYIKFNILNYIQEIFFFFLLKRLGELKKKNQWKYYEFKIIFFY